MKIAILARILNQNSGARAPIKLAEHLAKRGNHVDFYSFDILLDQKVQKRLEEQGIRVYIITIPKVRILGNLAAAAKVFFLMLGKNYTLISAHTPSIFVIAAKLAGAFIVRTYYGTQLSQLTIAGKAGLEVHPNLSTQMISWLWDTVVKFDERMGFIFSDFNITISRYLKQEMKELYGNDISYIYLGAETEKFNSESIKSVKPTKKKIVTLLSVSRIVPYKGFDLIIKAFGEICKKHANVELKIIGSVADPVYLDYLKRIKNEKVQIIHNPSDAELLKYYQDCQIYVCGDLWVPWSLTPLEASFFGKPLLGLNKGAMNEIIKHNQNGLLANDERELAVYLNKLVEDEKLREKLGTEARLRVREFSWHKTVSGYMKLFRGLKE